VAAEDPGAVAARVPSGEQPIRAAEVVGALSLATDLGTGQPLEHALRSAVLAVRLGELAGASAQELADTYYVALLHASGCTSNGHEAAQLYGDDIAHRAAFFLIDPTNPAEVLAFYRAYVGAGRPAEVRAALVEEAIANAGPRARDAFAAMCEVAQRFAGWLDLGSGIQAALEYVFARWDGRGFPDARGDAIPLPMRLLHVARDISLFLSASGADEARAVVERRTGAAYEPRLAGLAVQNFADLLADLDETRMWEQALGTEPFPQVRIAGERVDAAFTAIAALTGLKSPWLREHSTGVAELAEAAAWRMGLPAADVTLVRRAALAHDLGRAWVCPTRSGRSLGRSGSGNGSGCDSILTSRSAPSPSRRRSLRSGDWPAHTTSGSTVPATTAARAGRLSTSQPASSPRPTATGPCARRGRTGRLSMRRRQRRRSRGRPKRGGSTRTPSTRCSPPPATACGSDLASFLQG
jgi:HD-GYP domain-containing protein (c-di-GMP phosphodiesterase class II)